MSNSQIKSLIFGISGQDGAYLSANLLLHGHTVFGTTRNLNDFRGENLEKLNINKQLEIFEVNVEDRENVTAIIQKVQPDEIYYLAGQSSAALSFQYPAETFSGIVTGTLNILEVIRLTFPQCRVFFAGSGDPFVDTKGHPIDETTAFSPKNPYGAARVAAYWLIRNYRELYSLFVCTGILFNHESPLRPANFVTSKIIQTARQIAEGKANELRLGRLDIVRDWGWAPEYVAAMRLMLLSSSPSDYVIGTGHSMSLKEFVAEVFSNFNLDLERYVKVDPSFVRPNEVLKVRVNPTLIQEKLGWTAQTTARKVIRKMINNELY